VKNESQLWGDHYQSDVNGLLSLQDKITTGVSSKLGIGISPEAQKNLAKSPTENTQAYQLYLQGRYYWNKRSALTLEKAINYFNQAIALDSNYALAYAGLADCYSIQSQYSGIPTKITVPLARSNAEHAIRINSSLAEAHTTLAMSYFSEWKYEEAEREFKRAIALNPRYPTAYHWYNLLLLRTGRLDEAESIIKKGYDLDSYSPVITLNMGAIGLRRKQYEDALRYFQKSIELEPSFAPGYEFSGVALDGLHKDREALENYQKSVELSGRSSEALSWLGNFYARKGKREEATKLLHEDEDRYRAGTGAAYNIAAIYAGFGDKEKAMEWLDRDVEDQSTFSTNLLSDVRWDNIRTDPHFISIVKKVGLVK
jgi:serine/threonine-protein kinase